MPETADTNLPPSFASPRHLAVVLLQLELARSNYRECDSRMQKLGAGSIGYISEEARYAQFEREAADLENEARGMIASATGVPWDIIERASL